MRDRRAEIIGELETMADGFDGVNRKYKGFELIFDFDGVKGELKTG